MIGKPEWFKRRKYGGWGIVPKTWQGYVYILAFLIPYVIFQALPYWNNLTRVVVTIVFFAILAIDTFIIMAKLNKDEREKIHEAIAERNALWTIVAILAAGIAYQTSLSVITMKNELDIVIIIALVAALIVKAVTNIYLDRKD